MQILIPMAGAGQRFRDAGFQLPKPLIEVDTEPMVVRVVKDLPDAARLVFVVNRDHVRDYAIDDVLRSYFPSARIVTAPGLTEGQACSVQLGVHELDPEQPVLVAACDNTHIFDEARFTELTRDMSVDAVIWTYRNEPRVLVNPHSYGWVSTRDDDHVDRVSVKVPLSVFPLTDHVVSGSFWFKSARFMNEQINALIESKRRVNGEYYLDSVPDMIVQQGGSVRTFEVTKYIGWGTPADWTEYQHLSTYVRRRIDLKSGRTEIESRWAS